MLNNQPEDSSTSEEELVKLCETLPTQNSPNFVSPGHVVNKICDAAGVTPICLDAVHRLSQERREKLVQTIWEKLDYEITAQLETACSQENETL